MTTITLPTVQVPNHQEFGLKSHTRTFTSPFTGYTQSQSTPGSLWVCSYKYPPLTDAQAKIFKAFFMQLRGQVNSFTARDFGFDGQVSSSITATAILGANTAVLSSPLTLSIGDYIKIGSELKQVTADSIGTSATIEPPFRAAHTASAVVTEKPTCTMLLNQDSFSMTMIPNKKYSVEFSGIEVFV